MKICTILVFILVGFSLFSQNQDKTIKNISLGDDTVQLHIYTKSGKDLAYAHVHENETASLEAGLEILNRYGGKLVTLVHSFDGTKNRNVTFSKNKTTYRFDPNRIYTNDTKVLSNSIQVVKGAGKVDQEVIQLVKKLANTFWEEIKGKSMVIALHNNKNTPAEFKTKWLFWKKIEPESYNIISYIKRYDQSSESNQSCDDIYINPAINNSEFLIVTERSDFDMLVRKRHSVVLQNNHPIDDGSMSVFAYKQQKRYINSEAKMGRVQEQTAMLDLLLRD